MTVLLEAVVSLLVAGLLFFSGLEMVVGLICGFFGEHIERCTECDRLSLTVDGGVQPAGFLPSAQEHLAHLARAVAHDVRLRHP